MPVRQRKAGTMAGVLYDGLRQLWAETAVMPVRQRKAGTTAGVQYEGLRHLWAETTLGRHTKDVTVLHNDIVDLIRVAGPKQSENGWTTNYRPLSDEDVCKGWVDLNRMVRNLPGMDAL